MRMICVGQAANVEQLNNPLVYSLYILELIKKLLNTAIYHAPAVCFPRTGCFEAYILDFVQIE